MSNVPSNSNTDKSSVASHSASLSNSVELWRTLINAESANGWWDITFMDNGVVISKFSDDQQEMEIEVSVAEWSDLTDLILRLTKLVNSDQKAQVSDTTDDQQNYKS